MSTAATTAPARDVRGTTEYVADRQNRLGAIARRAQIGLDLDVEVDLSHLGAAGAQLDLFA